MRSATRPLLVHSMRTPQQSCTALESLDLKRSASSGGHDEDWIQDLVYRHPAVLPLTDIEPAFVDARSICRELPTPSGFVDNLLMTPEGGLVIVEAKLWRNPQARREVIGQVLDYAKDLKRWSYEELEVAVRRARKDRASLAELVLGDATDEAAAATFFDAVSRNLRLGRFLCIVVGDGIQEAAEQLADFLQQHVGVHFTLAMVELSLWSIPGGQDVFVCPRVILRTVQIERPVVRLESGPELAKPPSAPSAPQTVRAISITEDQFYEQLGKVGADLPNLLRTFLTELEDQGVRPDIKKGLSLKWRSPSGTDFTVGLIQPTDALVQFDYCNWTADSIGRLDLSHAYLAQIAGLLEGGFVRETPKPTGWNVKTQTGWATLRELLTRASEWKAAIARYTEALSIAEPSS